MANPIQLITLSVGLVMLLLAGACTQHPFPVVHPSKEVDRRALARHRAQEYFVKARDYDRRGLYQMAEHFYEMAYELDPVSEILRNELAAKYVATGKYAQALVLVKGVRKISELSVPEKRRVADLYMKMLKFDLAAVVLEQLPDLSDSEKYSLGLVYESMARYPKAIEYYTQVFDGAGRSAGLGMKVAQLHARLENFHTAESLYVLIEQEFGERPELFIGLGNMRLQAGDTAMTLDLFKTASLLDSSSTEALRNIARIAIERNDYAEAITYYEKLYESSDHGELYGRTLALLYYYNKEYDKAERLLATLIPDNIDDYELHFYLGLVFFGKEQYSLAEIELEKTIALRKDFADAWKQLCYLKLRQKDVDEALAYAEGLRDIQPEIAGSWRLLGSVYNARKEHEKAAKALEKATALDPNDGFAWFERGSALERTKRYDEAAAAFRRALGINPDDAAAANYLAYMWAEQGIMLDSAKALLEGALKDDPDNGAYLDSYVWVFYKMGDVDKALLYIRKALAVMDTDPVIYSHYGDILVLKKELNDAIEVYKKSISLGAKDQKEIEAKIKKLEQLISTTPDVDQSTPE